MTRAPRLIAALAIQPSCVSAAISHGAGAGSKASCRTCSTDCARCYAAPASPSSHCFPSRSASARIPAIFSLMDAVMLRSLPVKNPQQLVLLGKGKASGITDVFGVTELYSYPFYRELQKRNQVFSETAAIFSITKRCPRHRLQVESVRTDACATGLGNVLPTLGVQAMIGRTLTDQDDSTQGDHPVAVVSYSWSKKAWRAIPMCSIARENRRDDLQHRWRGSS